MRTFAVLALVAVLAGCTTVQQAPSQTYRAKGSDRLQIISGELTTHDSPIELRFDMTVKLDGVPVASGSIGRGNGEVIGRHNGQTVQSMCSRSDTRTSAYTYSPNITCRVVIDGEFVATLTFS